MKIGYASHFTPEEMREMERLYRTPLGQKALLELPTIAAESRAVGQAWGAKVGREAIEAHKQELLARGVRL